MFISGHWHSWRHQLSVWCVSHCTQLLLWICTSALIDTVCLFSMLRASVAVTTATTDHKNLVGLIYFSICSYVLCRHVWQCTGWLLTQMAVDSDIWYCSARWLCHLWRRLISLAMLWAVCDSILRCAVILLFIMKLASHSRMCILHSLLYVRHCCEKSPCNSVPRTQLVNFDYQPRSTFGMLLQLQDKYCLKESTCCIASYKALGLCCCSEVFT